MDVVDEPPDVAEGPAAGVDPGGRVGEEGVVPFVLLISGSMLNQFMLTIMLCKHLVPQTVRVTEHSSLYHLC